MRFHYWLVGRLVVTLESDNQVYMSLDEAVEYGKTNGRAGIVLTLIALSLHILSLVCLLRKKTELKSLRTEREKVLNEYSEFMKKRSFNA